MYQQEHVPLAIRKLEGKTKIVATNILTSPQGAPPYYRIAEIHFPSMTALEACAAVLVIGAILCQMWAPETRDLRLENLDQTP